ncbi:hypothetical protein JCM13304A_05960 [Desulfothermus okinawensis JCM 13304]
MRIFVLIFGVIFLISISQIAQSNIIDDLLNNYKNIHSIETKFHQILKSKTTKDEEIRSGKIFCEKIKDSVKVRWEVTDPEKEILIVNGETIWDYFPEEKLAYKYKLSKVEQSKIIFDLISGKLDLKEKFNIKIEDQGKNIGLTKIKLVPFNPEPNMVLVYLWIDEKNLIKKIDIIDFFGNENIIEFNDININKKTPQGLYGLPKGIKILEGRPN